MKCLHILPMDKLSGAEKMALILCKNMKEFEPVVICGGVNLKKVFEDAGIKSYDLSFSYKKFFKTLTNIKKIVKENNIGIIHAHDNNASVYAYLSKQIYKLDVKVLSHIHSCYPFLKENNLNKKIDSILRPKYDCNIVCGKLVYEFYINNTNYIKKEKFQIISNAIEIIDKRDKKEIESIRKKFNIPKNKIIIGFCGRICDIKGIIPFINEFYKNKSDFIDCKILLVGSGEQEEEVKKLIKRLGIKEFFILTGFQKNINSFYQVIDILFLPSLYEGLPMVILEAMSFKKPIVSMNVGSIEEVVTNDVGILVEPGNYKEFIIALRRLKNDKKLMRIYGENGYKFVSSNYSIKSYVNKMEEQYKSSI